MSNDNVVRLRTKKYKVTDLVEDIAADKTLKGLIAIQQAEDGSFFINITELTLGELAVAAMVFHDYTMNKIKGE